MDLMKQILFESPFGLGVVCFILFSVVLLARKRMESDRARRRALPMTLSVIVLLFLIQWVVVTDRERVLDQLDIFVAGVTSENVVAAGQIVGSVYSADGLDREGFLRSLRDWFDMVDIRDPRFQRRDVTVEGDVARMTLAASATVSIRGDVGQTHAGVWRLEWQREDEMWRITKIEPVSIDLQPVSSLQGLRGLAGSQ